MPDDAASKDAPLICAECEKPIPKGTATFTENAAFCQSCYEKLASVVEDPVDAQSRDINYTMAVVGGLLGGFLGALVWWGFTVTTNIAFGLVAVLIGIAVGKGVVILSGNKRAVSLQAISIVISILSYVMAIYWVNRSFIHKAYAEQGEQVALPFIPDPNLLLEVVRLDIGIFEVVFLGIIIWEAWKIPRPIRLQLD